MKGKNNPFYNHHHSEENKKRWSNLRKGSIPWNKGKIGVQISYKKGKTHEEIFGKEKSIEINKKIGDKNRGKTYEEIYGSEKAKELKEKRREHLKKNNPMTNEYNKKIVSKKLTGIIRSDSTRKKIRLLKIKSIIENKNNGFQISPSYNPNACKIIDEYGKQNGYKFQHAMNGGEYYIKDLGYWVDGYDKNKNTVIEYYERKHKKTTERDERRKQEIIDFLKCKFIEIKE
jgi:hypothetical protein